MRGMECKKKGCKNESSHESRNESDGVQMTADCKNTNEQYDSVNDEKNMISVGMN